MRTEAEKSVTRSCIVNGQEAVFHCWGQGSTEKKLKNGEYSVVHKIYGVVEFADGSCAQVIPELIQFTQAEPAREETVRGLLNEQTDRILEAIERY